MCINVICSDANVLPSLNIYVLPPSSFPVMPGKSQTVIVHLSTSELRLSENKMELRAPWGTVKHNQTNSAETIGLS